MYNATERLTDYAFQDADVGHLLRETRGESHDEPNALLAGTDLWELPDGPLRRFCIDFDDDQLQVTNVGTHRTAIGSITMSASLTGSVLQIDIGSTGSLVKEAPRRRRHRLVLAKQSPPSKPISTEVIPMATLEKGRTVKKPLR